MKSGVDTSTFGQKHKNKNKNDKDHIHKDIIIDTSIEQHKCKENIKISSIESKINNHDLKNNIQNQTISVSSDIKQTQQQIEKNNKIKKDNES